MDSPAVSPLSGEAQLRRSSVPHHRPFAIGVMVAAIRFREREHRFPTKLGPATFLASIEIVSPHGSGPTGFERNRHGPGLVLNRILAALFIGHRSRPPPGGRRSFLGVAEAAESTSCRNRKDHCPCVVQRDPAPSATTNMAAMRILVAPRSTISKSWLDGGAIAITLSDGVVPHGNHIAWDRAQRAGHKLPWEGQVLSPRQHEVPVLTVWPKKSPKSYLPRR